MELELNAGNFAAEVTDSKKTVIVDFWAEWCGPCRMLAPVIEQIAKDYPDITVGKVNVDKEPELSNRYNITSIPTVILFRNGMPAAASVGYRDKNALIKVFEL